MKQYVQWNEVNREAIIFFSKIKKKIPEKIKKSLEIKVNNLLSLPCFKVRPVFGDT